MLEWTPLQLCHRIQQNHRTEGTHRENPREKIRGFPQVATKTWTAYSPPGREDQVPRRTPEHQAQHPLRVVPRFTHQSPWKYRSYSSRCAGPRLWCTRRKELCMLEQHQTGKAPFLQCLPKTLGFVLLVIGAVGSQWWINFEACLRLPFWGLAVSHVPVVASGCKVQRPEHHFVAGTSFCH